MKDVEIGRRYCINILDCDEAKHTARAYPISKSETIDTPEEYSEFVTLAKEMARGLSGELIPLIEHDMFGCVRGNKKQIS